MVDEFLVEGGNNYFGVAVRCTVKPKRTIILGAGGHLLMGVGGWLTSPTSKYNLVANDVGGQENGGAPLLALFEKWAFRRPAPQWLRFHHVRDLVGKIQQVATRPPGRQ
jgi:hypothetical protein